ncbi:MAG: DUF5667 domain-containing protein [Patescibacteria group bacterium]
MSKFNEIIKKAKAVRMKPEEKSEIRARLYAVARGGEVQSEKFKVKSWGFSFLKPMPIFASLMIALLAGGGVSFASENSLPGDLLYPIKVNVNEEVRARLAVSTEAKASWDTELADRRLIEVEQLSDRGKLTEERQSAIVQKFEEHADHAQERLVKLSLKSDTKAAAKISAKIESVIKKHGKILAKIGNAKSEMAPVTLAAKADAAVEVHNEKRSDQESKIESVAEKGKKAAVNKIAEVRKFISVLAVEIQAKAEARFQLADQAVVEADAKIAAQLPGEAFILYRKAHRLAQEAKDYAKELREESEERAESEVSEEESKEVEVKSRAPVLPKVEIKEALKEKIRIGL